MNIIWILILIFSTYCFPCSFHVGSGSQNPGAYEVALRMAAELFEAGYEMGYRFSLLDIGGGFPGDKGSKEAFQRVTSAINSSLATLFSSYQPGLTVIAEPGEKLTQKQKSFLPFQFIAREGRNDLTFGNRLLLHIIDHY